MSATQGPFCQFQWQWYNETLLFTPHTLKSQVVTHFWIFRLFMKGKFYAYVLWPLAQSVQNWIVDRSTTCDFTVNGIKLHFFHKNIVLNSTLWSSNNVATGNLPETQQAMAGFHQFSGKKAKIAVFPVY